jgi:hypothetical protein
VAGAVSKLTAGTSGPALQVINSGSGTALELRVGDSTTAPADKVTAPMKVDSQAKVLNLNADEIDGRDVGSFASSAHSHAGGDITSGTVAETRIDGSLTRDGEVMTRVWAADGTGSGLDADQIDGLDSTTFGITTQHNQQDLESCYTPAPNPTTGFSARQACAPLTVVVPPGKRYVVSVWSTFSVYGSWTETQLTQQVRYCSGMQAPGQAQPDCVTPFGVQNAMTARREEYVAASTSGETLPLTEGTYTFATIVMPQAHNLSQTSDFSGDTVVTRVLVRDAAPEPSGVSIPWPPLATRAHPTRSFSRSTTTASARTPAGTKTVCPAGLLPTSLA